MDPTVNLEINPPISLGKVDVEFVIDDQLVRTSAEASQRFAPSPYVALEVRDIPRAPKWSAEPIGCQDTFSKVTDFEALHAPPFADGPSSITLGYGTTIDVVPSSWWLFQDSNVFRLAHSPTVVLDSHEPITRVQFTVLNFASDEIHRSIVLQARPWILRIEPVAGLTDLERALGVWQGFGITHRGSLERSDGREFSARDAEKLLLGLDHFLSFVCGARCSINTAIGIDSVGVEVWKRWGSYHVSRWRRRRSWFDITIMGALSNLFESFWQQFQTSENGFGRILRLYAETNDTDNADVSIILAQTALEIAAHIWNVEDNSGRASERIAHVLLSAGIPVDVPDRLPLLEDLREREGWEHGPHTITEVRNPAIHADQLSVRLRLADYHEAKQLALWYLESLGGVVKRVCSRSSLPGAGRWPNTTPFSWHSGSPPRTTA